MVLTYLLSDDMYFYAFTEALDEVLGEVVNNKKEG